MRQILKLVPFVAHTERISSEALARVGLHTSLAPTPQGQIRFATAVGATDAANRNLLSCVGRDHRMRQANCCCIVLTAPGYSIPATA